VQGVTIRIGINSYRLDAHFRAGADNANRDFATIGYEDFLDHWRPDF